MKTAVSIPDPVFEAGERLARQLGVSRSELYANAIASYVEARRRTEVTEALNRVYPDEGNPLDPVLAEIQAESIGSGEW